MTHHFDPEVAVKLGINGAIIIANLAYLQRNREAQGGEKYFIDGRWWVHHTYESLQKVHPYFSLDQLRRTMKKLLDEGAVFRSQPDSWNRDSYWSVAPEFMQSAESPDRIGEIAGSQVSKSPVVLHDNKHRTTTPCSPPSKIPVQQIVDLYHQLLPMLPPVRKLTKQRAGYIQQRWREGDLPSIEVWEKYFGYVSQSKFLTGGIEGRDGKPPFRADLEWITKPANYAKIFEGKYHV
jgi:hypothetical protein